MLLNTYRTFETNFQLILKIFLYKLKLTTNKRTSTDTVLDLKKKYLINYW